MPIFEVSTQTPPSSQASKAALLWFTILAATTLLVRLTFISRGLPYIYHPDKPSNLAIIDNIIGNSDPDPHQFIYPSLLFYINIPGQYLVRWWDGALIPFTMQSMGNGFTHQPEAFIVGRATTLLFGVGNPSSALHLGSNASARSVSVVRHCGFVLF